jgi:hypothetical protein
MSVGMMRVLCKNDLSILILNGKNEEKMKFVLCRNPIQNRRYYRPKDLRYIVSLPECVFKKQGDN